MPSRELQLRVGDIIPTRFDTTIGCFGDERFVWQAAAEDEFFLAVARQLNYLAEIWQSLTDYRMGIVSRISLVDLPVRHLARRDRRRKLEIEIPAPTEFWNRGPLRNAMLRCFWIPYPSHVCRRLESIRKSSVKGHFARGTIWMPCDECREMHRSDFRRGLGHEFKHGLVHLLKEAGVNEGRLPDPDEHPDCRRRLVSLLTSGEDLSLLSRAFPADPEW